MKKKTLTAEDADKPLTIAYLRPLRHLRSEFLGIHTLPMQIGIG
jgi:hypothetical protein